MRGRKILLLLIASLPLCLLAKANGGAKESGKAEPVLQGIVSDATTKKPVEGVIISISTSKGQQKKEFTTDASGNFKVPHMPVGEIVIVLEKKGYKTCRREGVIIKEGSALKLNFDILNNEDDESDVFHPLMRMMEGE